VGTVEDRQLTSGRSLSSVTAMECDVSSKRRRRVINLSIAEPSGLVMEKAGSGGLQDRTTARIWAGWTHLLAQVERITRRADGEDLLHDAYVRMADSGAAPMNEAAYLVRAAVNGGRDAYRREKVRGTLDGADAGEGADDAIALLQDGAPIQDEILIARARLQRVREGIDQLSSRTRDVFLLQRFDGLKYREVADRLGISERAVEKHMAKAMAFLGEWTKDW
jgi:RNA polymerase sigma-70 factor (ECF subfamily)